ncbi:hypothetical protein [Streptomyces sp. NPDC014676]|uniref:hypothetical protein n=1 Tax=Streptomyces sp. NPDC014676 TaxID=3364879 RepID=UPI0036FEC7EC
MSRYSGWTEVRSRLRENRPEVSDAERKSRKRAAARSGCLSALAHASAKAIAVGSAPRSSGRRTAAT